jgi:hypothetical protein
MPHTNMTIDEHALSMLTGPELASMRMDVIEARLRTVERQLSELGRAPEEQDVVLVSWRMGQITQQWFVATSIRPDNIDTAIDKLRNGMIAWARPCDVDAVVAGAVAVVS